MHSTSLPFLPSKHLFLAFLLFFSLGAIFAQEQDSIAYLDIDIASGRPSLTEAGASHFAKLALHCIGTEFPNKLSHVMNSEKEILGPSRLHPAFYGCFDWHSSVHGHWMLIRLLKLFPDIPEGPEIRTAIAQNLTAVNIQAEIAYLKQRSRKSFERTYGWAWLLKLTEELNEWEDEEGKQWGKNLAPLAETFVQRYLAFLPKQTYPIRTGVHPNTAFGLSFAHDYAVSTGHAELKRLIEFMALKYYGFDADCPADWEPGGSDFLSPCLEEANLMRRVLKAESFKDWYGRFMPRLNINLREPATVSDRSDGQLVHLDGLNLSRSWCMLGIAQVLPEGDPRKDLLLETANRHILATLPHIASGDYAGEHWLASFAVYALSVE
ncbi:MAG: DUF2891 domain-containing protein [Bacteroidota bacterium]